ncbi:MAG: PD-(D/E)XK nuclease family protein [DPANN group archaeon]|nr:PD-(D/E)XK nuclease family protein [DPANN group archaeon]
MTPPYDTNKIEHLTPTAIRQCYFCERSYLWNILKKESAFSDINQVKIILGTIGHDIVSKIEQSKQMVEFFIDNNLDSETYLKNMIDTLFEDKFKLNETALKAIKDVSDNTLNINDIKSDLLDSIEDYSDYIIKQTIEDCANERIPHYTIMRIEPFQKIIELDSTKVLLRGIPDLVHIQMNNVITEEIKFKLDSTKIPYYAHNSDIVQLGAEAILVNDWSNLKYFNKIAGINTYFDDKHPHMLNYNGRKKEINIESAMLKAEIVGKRCLEIIKESDISSLTRQKTYICEKCSYKDVDIDGTCCMDYV